MIDLQCFLERTLSDPARSSPVRHGSERHGPPRSPSRFRRISPPVEPETLSQSHLSQCIYHFRNTRYEIRQENPTNRRIQRRESSRHTCSDPGFEPNPVQIVSSLGSYDEASKLVHLDPTIVLRASRIWRSQPSRLFHHDGLPSNANAARSTVF